MPGTLTNIKLGNGSQRTWAAIILALVGAGGVGLQGHRSSKGLEVQVAKLTEDLAKHEKESAALVAEYKGKIEVCQEGTRRFDKFYDFWHNEAYGTGVPRKDQHQDDVIGELQKRLERLER